MPKKIIVTGGAGFIGSHVVDRLVRRRYEVHIVDNLTTGFRQLVNPMAKLHEIDICSDQLKRIFRRVKPFACVHLAAHVDLRSSYEHPVDDAEVNVMGSLNVLESCAAAGTRNLAFASSSAVYSPSIRRMPIVESDPKDPNSPYGIAKYAFELYLNSLAPRYGINAAALRFGNVYGPRQTVKGEAGAVAIFSQKLIQGKVPTINGHGRQTRDYIFVGDVADMVVAAAVKGLNGPFSVGTREETSVNGLYAAVAKAVGTDIRAKHGPAKPGDDRRVVLNTGKAKRAAGWQARVRLQEGIDQTVEWAKRYLEAGGPVR